MTVISPSKDPLLQPLTIRGLTLKNRVMSTSHASAMDDDTMPAERYQRYHEEKAKGGLAPTMFGGSSNIAPNDVAAISSVEGVFRCCCLIVNSLPRGNIRQLFQRFT